MKPWELKPARDLGLSPRERIRSLNRENSLLEGATHLGWWSLVRSYLSMCHRLKIEGRHNIPTHAPFILVANHTSHLDALILGACLPWSLREKSFPIAAGDTFFETPAMAAFAAFALNALPMWRRNCGSHAMQTLRERLVEEPCVYILFPEGTRSRDGRMAPFKAGIGMLVTGTDVPVLPCYISGGHQAWPPNRILPRLKKIHIHIGAPRTFPNTPNTREGWVMVAETLWNAVQKLVP